MLAALQPDRLSLSPNHGPDAPTSALSKSIRAPRAAPRREWNPAKQLLVCPFCGTAAPFNVDAATGAIEELDLAKALRELPDDQRGWLTEKRTVQCQSCKAVSVFDPERVGQNCEFCGSPALVDYEEIKAPIRPQSLLPFKVAETQVREQIRSWYASKWLAPNASRAARSSTASTASTSRTGRSTPTPSARGRPTPGTTTTRPRPSRQNGRTQTRQVRHVRWEPASGEVRHFFDDEPVPGTQGVSRRC